MAIVLSEATYNRIMNVVRKVESWGSFPGGVQALSDSYKPTGTELYLVKTLDASNKGTSASTVMIYNGTPGSESVISSSQTLNPYNHFGNVASGKWGIVARINYGTPYLICAEC